LLTKEKLRFELRRNFLGVCINEPRVLSGALESSSVADADLKVSDADVNGRQTSEEHVTDSTQGAPLSSVTNSTQVAASSVKVVVDEVGRSAERSLVNEVDRGAESSLADSVDGQYSAETETLMRLKDMADDDKDVMTVTDKTRQSSSSYATSVTDVSIQ